MPNREIQTLQLHAESLEVTRHRSEGDTVRVQAVTRQKEQNIDEELQHERVKIERVPINRLIVSAPDIRQEGDTMIVSVVEEIVVVERRLMLKEEIRITRERVTERHQETVVVREQEAVVTRTPARQKT